MGIEAGRTLQNRAFLGILLMMGGLAIYALSDAFLKCFMASYPVPQALFLRALTRLCPLLFVAGLQGGGLSKILATDHPKNHLVRLLVNLAYTAAFMYAFSMGSLTFVYTLSYTSPFFMIALSALILKERVPFERWVAVGIGMIGIVIAMKPQPDLLGAAALLALTGTFLGALHKILMRRLAATEHSLTIAIYPNIAMMLATCLFLFHNWQPMPWSDWALFAFVGAFTAAGQYAIVQALRFAQGSVLASIDYSTFFWVALLDYLWWQKAAQPHIFLGAAIIVGSNLYILYCTRREEARKRTRDVPMGA